MHSLPRSISLLAASFLVGGCCVYFGEGLDYKPVESSSGFSDLLATAKGRANALPTDEYDIDGPLRDEIFEAVGKENPIEALEALGAQCQQLLCIYADVSAVTYHMYQPNAHGAIYVETVFVQLASVPIRDISDLTVFHSHRGHYRD